MAIGSIILLHTFRCTKHVVGLLHFLHTFEGTIMIDEIKKSIEHLERTRRHAQCHIGMVDAQGTFAWNPLAAVAGSLQFQSTGTVAEERPTLAAWMRSSRASRYEASVPPPEKP